MFKLSALNNIYLGQDGVISMETEAQAGQPMNCSLIPSTVMTFLSSLKHPDRPSGPPSSLFWGYWGGFFWGVKWLVCEADRSPLYSAFMVWTETLLLFVSLYSTCLFS